MQQNKIKITCAIIAGGKSTRMGGLNKAFIQVQGKSIIQRIIDVVDPIFNEIIIITNQPDDFSSINYPKFNDVIGGKGPLSGIHAALNYANNSSIFYLPCDMPYLDKNEIGKQIDFFRQNNFDAVIPAINQQVEPMHGIIKKEQLRQLEYFLKNSSKNDIKSFYKTLKLGIYNIDDTEENRKIFTNINSHTDIWPDENNLNFIDENLWTDKKNLLAILHKIQDNSPQNYISDENMAEVARRLNITQSQVYGVVSYYSMFSLKPRGKHIIRACNSPVCNMKGAENFHKEITHLLDINSGETTANGQFTFETCECLGRCGKGPSLMIDNDVYVEQTPQSVINILNSQYKD